MSVAQSNLLIVFGSAIKNLIEATSYILAGKIEKQELRSNLVFIGFECLPMICILTAVSCMILTLNTSYEMTQHGGRELVGAMVAIADLREILPMFIAFAIAARCGTTMTAEISTMKVTEQIDALKVMNAPPVFFLLAPRLLATIVLVPFLLAFASIVSIFAGMLVAKMATGIEFEYFLESAWKAISMKEYFYPLIKTECFCAYAILMNITMGIGCSGGAKEVGLATTRATALVMVGIIILDGILTPILYA